MINVFTDGGARGNPGPAAIGVYIENEKHEVLYELGETIGVATNNAAEYRAVIAALSFLSENKDIIEKGKEIHFYLDSLLLVSQINGLYKVKNANLLQLLLKVREKESLISVPMRYSHVQREKNKKADSLVNRALDKK